MQEFISEASKKIASELELSPSDVRNLANIGSMLTYEKNISSVFQELGEKLSKEKLSDLFTSCVTIGAIKAAASVLNNP